MTKELFQRGRYNVYLYILLGISGFGQSVLGSIAPFTRDDHNLNTAQIGWLFGVYALGVIASTQIAKLSFRHIAIELTMKGSAIAMAFSILSFCFINHIALILLASFLLGLFIGIVQISIQMCLALHNREFQSVAIAEAFVFAAVGVFMGPFMIGISAGTVLGWKTALIVPFVALGTVFVMFRRNTSAEFDRKTIDDFRNGKKSSKKMLSMAVLLLLVMVLLGIATEWGLGFWGAHYLEIKLQIDKNVAVTTMSVFFGGTVVGRISIARLLRSISLHIVLYGMITVGAVSVALLAFSTATEHVWVALFVGGFCLGNYYPLILAAANDAAPESAPEISRFATLAVGVALLTVPYTIGQLGYLVGLTTVIGLLAVFPLGMLVLYNKSLALSERIST